LIQKDFIKNAAAVCAVSLIMNTVGILFRTYVSNRAGSEVMGLLQLVLSVYYPACTLASSGVYVASTSLCAEALARKDRPVSEILNRCFLYGLFFGISTFLLLFSGAKIIATHWLRYPEAEAPLRILSFGLPFLAIANALQGFFLSLRMAVYSTVLQITEDLSKIGGTMLLFALFLNRGPSAALCALTAGMAIGETVSCLIGYFLYLKKAKTLTFSKPVSNRIRLRDVTGIALPCAFSAYLRSGIGMVENVLVPRGLEASGLTPEQTLGVLGKLEGMALPILVFPAAFLAVVSKLLVPEITAENAAGHFEKNIKTTKSILNGTMTYAVFIGTFVLFFGKELGLAVYHDKACGGYLTVLAPLTPVLYGDRVIDGMLKGYNRQLTAMKINLLDSVLQTAGAWLLIPHWGIRGYLLIFCLGATVNFTLSFLALKRASGIRFPLREGILIPLLCALGAVLPWKLIRTQISFSVWAAGGGSAIGFLLLFLGWQGSLSGILKRAATGINLRRRKREPAEPSFPLRRRP